MNKFIVTFVLSIILVGVAFAFVLDDVWAAPPKYPCVYKHKVAKAYTLGGIAERYKIAPCLAHYASWFSAGGTDLARWAARKRAAAASKKWVNVQLTDLSIFLYPGREDLALVTFTQDYRSDSLAKRARKRQFWIQEGGRWKIAYEDAA